MTLNSSRKIGELLAVGPTFSFEFFPPRSDEAEKVLEQAIEDLVPLDPSFVSVTYGAGGSTRDRTRDIVIHIQRNIGITSMAHLTCIGHSRDELVALVSEYFDVGICNLLALAGDPPADPSTDIGDMQFASELVELIRDAGDFSIGVAAHPELHPRSGGDSIADRRYLAAKLDLADFAITQFFFEAEPYLRMVDELAALGCTKPVLPGIMPVTNAGQVQRFAQLAGAEFPPHLAKRFAEVSDDPVAVRSLGVALATDLCAELLAEGAPGLHFYTLNRSTATREIYANLGLGLPGTTT
ncbi:MAG: methylenetetrahydrofolate reductase [Actinomycetes bacterium]